MHLQMNIVSMAPITASQFGTNRLMQTMVLQKSESELNNAERFGAAAAAGAVSAFIASPSELIIIHQQVHGRGRSGRAPGSVPPRRHACPSCAPCAIAAHAVHGDRHATCHL